MILIDMIVIHHKNHNKCVIHESTTTFNDNLHFNKGSVQMDYMIK